MKNMFKISGNPEKFADLDVFHKLSQQFLPYAQKRLGFDKPVSINLLSDPQNASNPLGKTAYYDPNKLEVTLFIDKRHIKDILRSMSHELVHHTQNCRGEFDGGVNTGPGYAQEDGHMRKMEKEAYLEGQMMLRDFEDNLKKENQKMSRVNENKMPMKKDTEDIDGDGRTDDEVPAFLQKGDVKKKKTGRPQPPQLAKAQGKDVDEAHCPSGKRDDKEVLDEIDALLEEEFQTLQEELLDEEFQALQEEVDEAHCPSGKRDDDDEELDERTKRDTPDRVAGRDTAGRRLKPLEEGWSKSKDKLLFERLVEKWAK